jgi:hypothetical protein
MTTLSVRDSDRDIAGALESNRAGKAVLKSDQHQQSIEIAEQPGASRPVNMQDAVPPAPVRQEEYCVFRLPAVVLRLEDGTSQNPAIPDLFRDLPVRDGRARLKQHGPFGSVRSAESRSLEMRGAITTVVTACRHGLALVLIRASSLCMEGSSLTLHVIGQHRTQCKVLYIGTTGPSRIDSRTVFYSRCLAMGHLFIEWDCLLRRYTQTHD